MAFQNKANPSLVALSTNTSSSKPSLFSAPKKQSNFLWVDLFSILAGNGKLTSDKHKKYLENNLCFYCGTGNHKLDFCPKKQTMVLQQLLILLHVVATTCWNGTCSILTSAKLTKGYLVVGITRELNKEPLLHCFSIYINTT